MPGSSRGATFSESLVRPGFFALVLGGWAALGVLCYAVYDYTEEWQMRAVALAEARAAVSKDLAYRIWAARQGGVYVPSDVTPPNPYLKVAHRDVTTTTGKHLTLVNPAYMTRLVQEFSAEMYGTRSRITSHKLTNPVNKPDPWESAALDRLQAGEAEIYALETERGRPYLRYMKPLQTRAECLKCHGEQGYREGDLRGGISVAIPLDGAEMLAMRGDHRRVGLVVALLWLVGLAGLLVARLLAGKFVASQAAAQSLVASGERERAKMHERLMHAQKMEAMGLFAGGVAHDFNNMLQAILGNAAVALDKLPAGAPAREYLANIQAVAGHSAALTRQLLAFAREQPIAPRRIDLNEQAAGMLRMLERIVGANVRLCFEPGAGLTPVFADPALVGRTVANLVLNARDAFARGGTVTVRTGAAAFAPGDPAPPGLAPGDYAWLSVADDGPGIEPADLPHVFEPFFTTKPVGKGTGLGLAAVYGAVTQSGGAITVESEPGHGAVFKVYYPAAGEAADTAHRMAAADPAGGATILLVDDEPAVRGPAAEVLRAAGYRVLTADSSEAAIAASRAHGAEPLDLLVTDVVLPGQDGFFLRDVLTSERPALKTLFISGYTAEGAGLRAAAQAAFLAKPFGHDELVRKVREVLGARPRV